MSNPKPGVAAKNEILVQAEAAVLALRDAYRVQLAVDVEALERLCCALEIAPSAQLLNAIHNVAHNVKGQGGSFGYELATSIGASLSDYLRSGERLSLSALNVVHMHIRMLKIISEKNITGTGGDMGQRIVDKLCMLTAS